MESVRTFADALLGLSAAKADELTMLQVCLRAVVVYLVLIGYLRFAKKRFSQRGDRLRRHSRHRHRVYR